MSAAGSSGSGGVRFLNADIGGVATTLHVAGSRIATVSRSAERGGLTLDMRGDRMLPGLINAHDHLQLNSLPRIPYSGRCRNARDWIADVNRSLQIDSDFAASAAASLEQRLLVGGMKNLLCGVTTAAHHDPLYPLLLSRHFPTRVLTDFGWAHSLQIDGDERVRQSRERTPRDWPWIVHAAEGVDDAAAAEFERLEALGCIGPNTRIVHGVALDRSQQQRLLRAGGGLIWCPSSNFALFGATARIDELVARGAVALGTDSRLTGARDLLEEVRLARDLTRIDEAGIEALVTADAARLLRLGDRGALLAGFRADLLVLPAGMPLSRATRADVRLVMIAGKACYADHHYAALLEPESHWAKVRVDGRPKVLSAAIAALLLGAGVIETGLELERTSWRAA